MEEKPKNIFKVLTTVAAVFGCIAVLLVVLCFIPTTDKTESFTQRPPVGNVSAEGSISTPTQDSSHNSQINAPIEKDVVIPGWTQIFVPSNSTDVTTVDFYNPDSNAGCYNMAFELFVNGESIYRSDLIEPGTHINRITLSRTFLSGEYDAVLKVQPYRLDNSPTNNAEIQLKMKVQ